jgi:hypothetical protein
MTSSNENQQAYETRLQLRLQILKELLEDGKIKFAPGLDIVQSLEAVRYSPDGTVDLSTVDGAVRSLALGAQFIRERDELKQAFTLAEVQLAYFQFLENNFGQFYEPMIAKGLKPADVASALSSSETTVDELYKILPGFIKYIEEFWDQTGETARIHVEDAHESLKGVFGGDLFPAHSQNIASKCGLYVDTLVLPDPFLRSRVLFDRLSPKQSVFYLLKHGLNLLQYKELATADVSPPIVVILPDTALIRDSEQDFIFGLGKRDAVMHAEKLFGRGFSCFDELMDYGSRLDTIDKAESSVTDEGRLLFDTTWTGGVKEQLQKAVSDQPADLLESTHPGIAIASNCAGRMVQINEHLIRSHRLRGTPVIEAPTSWKYFSWKLEYDAHSAEDYYGLTDLHVTRGLQNLVGGQTEWLGDVPPKALIEVRQSGAIEEIRAILSKGVEELALGRPNDFHQTTDRVFANIYLAFDDHKKKIAELTAKKWRFAGTEIGAWVVVGGLEVAAAATGLPVWGLASVAANQLTDIPKLKDIPRSIRRLAEESKSLNRSPVGLLFKIAEMNA